MTPLATAMLNYRAQYRQTYEAPALPGRQRKQPASQREGRGGGL